MSYSSPHVERQSRPSPLPEKEKLRCDHVSGSPFECERPSTHAHTNPSLIRASPKTRGRKVAYASSPNRHPPQTGSLSRTLSSGSFRPPDRALERESGKLQKPPWRPTSSSSSSHSTMRQRSLIPRIAGSSTRRLASSSPSSRGTRGLSPERAQQQQDRGVVKRKKKRASSMMCSTMKYNGEQRRGLGHCSPRGAEGESYPRSSLHREPGADRADRIHMRTQSNQRKLASNNLFDHDKSSPLWEYYLKSYLHESLLHKIKDEIKEDVKKSMREERF